MLKNSDVGVKRAWPLRVASTLVAAALLASCGGEAVEKFQPNRVMAFGDENSALDDGSSNANPTGGTGHGRQYGVNSTLTVGSPAQVDCTKNPIWVQIVASAFGTPLRQCNVAGLDPAKLGRTWAVPGAVVDQPGGDGIKQQIDRFLQVDAFNEKDLVLVMGGLHDVLNLYLQYDHANAVASRAALVEQAKLAGAALGAQVVRMTDAKAKVVVALQPDLALSPYAIREDTVFHSGEDRKGVMSALSSAFNSELRNKLNEVRGGGRFAGLVLTAGTFEAINGNPGGNGFVDAITPLCDAARASPPAGSPAAPTAANTNCDDAAANVTPDAIAGYVWADYLRYAPSAHVVFGSGAATRASDNSF